MPGQRLSNVIVLFRSDAAPPLNYTSVGNIIDFSGPQFTNERVEVTDGDSPSGSKEFLGARQDPGPLTCNMNFNFQNALHVGLFTDSQAAPPTVAEYKLQPSEATGDFLAGPAFVSAIALSGSSRNQALVNALTLQPSAGWSVTAA